MSVDRTLQSIADVLADHEAAYHPGQLCPEDQHGHCAARPRPVPSPEDRMADARTDTPHTFRTYLDATDRDQLDARAACAEAERDDALDARDVLRARLNDVLALASFRKGVIDRHRQELGAAGEVLAVVRDAAERIDRALATYDTTPGEAIEREDATPDLGSPARRAQEPTAGEARRLLDQAIDTALPLAGRSVRKLLKALRRELARVDAGRAPAGKPA